MLIHKLNNENIWNALAQNAGVPQAIHGATLTPEQFSMLQTLVQKHGAPALMAGIAKYNQDNLEYNRALQNAADYDKAKETMAIWNYKDDQALKAAFRYRDLRLGNKKI